MPFYEYQVDESHEGCAYCRRPFTRFQQIRDAKLTQCPACGAPLRKLFSAPSIGASRSGFDDRAKSAGFHKLQKIGTGEYEKQY